MPLDAGTDNHLLKLEETRALQVLSGLLDNQQRWHLAFAMGNARQIRDGTQNVFIDRWGRLVDW
jgi:hypothetical protein